MVFSSGNLYEEVTQFPSKHQCNKFCIYFNLKPLDETTFEETVTRREKASEIIDVDEEKEEGVPPQSTPAKATLPQKSGKVVYDLDGDHPEAAS